jgi:riboflavin biosynthesis pyrimidine reductase
MTPAPSIARFDVFAAKKTRDAESATIDHLRTTLDNSGPRFEPIGNRWTREHYDGGFTLSPCPEDRPAVSLVFVQSRDGNTVADDPADLGGGPTDTHLIYEGLTRVAADAVLAGAGAVGHDTFFSVWHPEIVRLRAALGLPRHPAQIVISHDGHVDLDALLFEVPEVPVFLLAGEKCRRRCVAAHAGRPWIHIVPFERETLGPTLIDLCREHRLRRVSAVGGRHTASHLVDAGLVQDLYLTTTQHRGGSPGTPWYAGSRRPEEHPVSGKEWLSEGGLNSFAHLLLALRRTRGADDDRRSGGFSPGGAA